MADRLHDLDDEKLKKMEKKISAIYKRAEKEVKATAEDFLKEFDKEDKKRAKEVLQGKETHDNYIAWREEQILRSKKYKEMQENIALQLSHTNEMAVAYVNGEMPPIYIANYNDLSNVVDGIGGYSFDLIDQNVLNELINENPTLLPERELDIPKDLKWNRKKIQSELLQGIIQGEPMDKIAKRMGRVTDMNRHSAIRNARTSVTNVENKGRMDSYIKAEKDGIILNKEWIATAGNRTRDSHARLNGTIIPYDQKFDNGLMYPADPNGRPEEVYNCFVGKTKVASDSEAVRSYKHYYNGYLINVKTASGVEFSCTPNHPILTPNGWVASKLLQNGDDILVTRCSNNRISRIYPNIKHTFTRMDTFHKFVNVFGGKRATSTSVNFHGDIPTSNVEIVTQKRFLRENRKSCFSDSIYKFLLVLTDKSFAFQSSLMQHFRSVCKSSFNFIGRFSELLPFFKSGISHSHIHRLRPVPDRNVVLPKYSINNLPADVIIDGELLDRLTSDIFVDKVVSIDTVISSCHIYNLQTVNGYYFVNSSITQNKEKCNDIFAIAKNCRCTMGATVVGFKQRMQVKDDLIEQTVVNNGVAQKVLMREQVTKQVNKPKIDVNSAIKEANNLGVKYAQFENMPIEQVENVVNAVKTLPKDCVPKFIGNGKDTSIVAGKKLGRKADQWYGVTMDYRPFWLEVKGFGYEKSDFDGGLIVGLNTTKFKTFEKLTKAKEEMNNKYFEKTGRYWSFNTDGKATAYHEIGHCYANVKGLPKNWNDLSSKWAEDSKCDMLKKPEEAFAEAWAGYHLKDRRLPKYIYDIIKELV